MKNAGLFPSRRATFMPVGAHLSKVELRKVAKFADAIHDEYCFRQLDVFLENKKTFPYGVPPSERAINFLKREVYRLGRFYRRRGLDELLEKEVRHRRESNVHKLKSFDNIFNVAFLCIFEADWRYINVRAADGKTEKVREGKFAKLSAADREFYVQQLTYADLHFVAPELLCGFLLQSGNPKLIRQKLKDGYTEPTRVRLEAIRNNKRIKSL